MTIPFLRKMMTEWRWVDEGATSEGAKNNDAEETGQAHEDNDDEEVEEEEE